MKLITEFSNEYRWLSNFWPCKIRFQEEIFPTVEHAYVASKSTDPDIWDKVLEIPADKAREVKRFGRTFQMRRDFDVIKVGFMTDFVRQKFYNDLELRRKLLNTKGYYIIEGNTWKDTFWGVCNGEGENHLGRIIMKVRKELLEDFEGK